MSVLQLVNTITVAILGQSGTCALLLNQYQIKMRIQLRRVLCVCMYVCMYVNGALILLLSRIHIDSLSLARIHAPCLQRLVYIIYTSVGRLFAFFKKILSITKQQVIINRLDNQVKTQQPANIGIHQCRAGIEFEHFSKYFSENFIPAWYCNEVLFKTFIPAGIRVQASAHINLVGSLIP